MLVGQELIAYVQQHELLNQTELARGAGYVRVNKSGRSQVQIKEFYNALLAAKGLAIAVGKAPGKPAMFETSVHKSGIVVLGRAYSQRMGVKPGDVLDIVIEGGVLQLVPKAAKAAARVKG